MQINSTIQGDLAKRICINFEMKWQLRINRVRPVISKELKSNLCVFQLHNFIFCIIFVIIFVK